MVKSAKGCSDSLTKTVAISSYPVTDFAILTTDFCGNLPLLIKDNSSVNYAGIDRLKVFWNWPATDDTSEFNHPSAGTVYNHTYESFGYQPQRQVNVKSRHIQQAVAIPKNGIKHFVCITATCIYAYTGVLHCNIDQNILLQNARDTSSFAGTGFIMAMAL